MRLLSVRVHFTSYSRIMRVILLLERELRIFFIHQNTKIPFEIEYEMDVKLGQKVRTVQFFRLVKIIFMVFTTKQQNNIIMSLCDVHKILSLHWFLHNSLQSWPPYLNLVLLLFIWLPDQHSSHSIILFEQRNDLMSLMPQIWLTSRRSIIVECFYILLVFDRMM